MGFLQSNAASGSISGFSNLADIDLTRHLMAEFSCYQIFWLFASIASHSELAYNNRQVTMPHQGYNISLYIKRQMLWLNLFGSGNLGVTSGMVGTALEDSCEGSFKAIISHSSC